MSEWQSDIGALACKSKPPSPCTLALIVSQAVAQVEAAMPVGLSLGILSRSDSGQRRAVYHRHGKLEAAAEAVSGLREDGPGWCGGRDCLCGAFLAPTYPSYPMISHCQVADGILTTGISPHIPLEIVAAAGIEQVMAECFT